MKEIIIILIQLFMFYIFPLFAGPTDAIGMVLLIIWMTFILSMLMGIISTKKTKYIYPLGVAILFIPSIFIYYNSSASIHAVWYLVVAYVGLGIGIVLSLFFKKIK
ncbi:MAG: hypothetical protein IKV94_04825 [Clostridia bacterium]|nr:hypothetical protein [Clostridia bacterium]